MKKKYPFVSKVKWFLIDVYVIRLLILWLGLLYNIHRAMEQVLNCLVGDTAILWIDNELFSTLYIKCYLLVCISLQWSDNVSSIKTQLACTVCHIS